MYILLANGFYIGISVILVHIVNRGSVNITTTHHILYMKYRSNKGRREPINDSTSLSEIEYLLLIYSNQTY